MMQALGGDNRGDSAHTSISFAASFRLQSGCQPYARTDHNQRPAVSPDNIAAVDCLTDITTINHR